MIDEIDRCLHPAMTAKIIKSFLQMAERRNTQLIITTHESRLLKDDLLRNDEISFMIKTKAGSTIIKSLDKYQLRADKKFMRPYLMEHWMLFLIFMALLYQ